MSPDKVEILRGSLAAVVASSFLSTIHLLIGILTALINLAILLPVILKQYPCIKKTFIYIRNRFKNDKDTK